MRALAVTALIAGALLRIATLSISVPAVDNPWRAWSYHAATRGPWNMYGPKGHTVRFAALDEPVVYPPLALDELALVGRVHLAMHHGRFDDDVALTRTIKGAIVLVDGVLAALLFAAAKRAAGRAQAWRAALAYWLNPATLMMTGLGFFDGFVAVPAVGAVIAASFGRPWWTGALLAAGVMTKPQGILVAPAVALALWSGGARRSGRERLVSAVAAAAVTAALIAAPLLAAGTTFAMMRSVAVLAGHDALSALAFNLWWIIGALLQPGAATEVMTHAQAIAGGMPSPRFVGTMVMSAAVIWGLTTARRANDLGLHAALAAFVVEAYFTLSVQVHENHFFLALPLLTLAASLRREFVPVLAALSVTWALNLDFVYGLYGGGAPDLSGAAWVDPSVVLALAHCAAFGWLGVTLARASRRTPSVDRAEAAGA